MVLSEKLSGDSMVECCHAAFGRVNPFLSACTQVRNSPPRVAVGLDAEHEEEAGNEISVHTG
jgi:hypothetical protein